MSSLFTRSQSKKKSEREQQEKNNKKSEEQEESDKSEHEDDEVFEVADTSTKQSDPKENDHEEIISEQQTPLILIENKNCNMTELPKNVTAESLKTAQTHGMKLKSFDPKFPGAWISMLKMGSLAYQGTKPEEKFLLNIYLNAAKTQLPQNYSIADTFYEDVIDLENDIYKYVLDLPSKTAITSEISSLNQNNLTIEDYIKKCREKLALILKVESAECEKLRMTADQKRALCAREESAVIERCIQGLKGTYKFHLNPSSYEGFEALVSDIRSYNSSERTARCMEMGTAALKAKSSPSQNFQKFNNNKKGFFKKGPQNYSSNAPPMHHNANNKPQNPIQQSTNTFEKKSFHCYKCGKQGHIAKVCRTPVAGTTSSFQEWSPFAESDANEQSKNVETGRVTNYLSVTRPSQHFE